MDSKIKIPAMVALVVLVALAFWYLRGMPDAPATEVDETTKASEDQDRGGTAAFTPNTETPPDARAFRTPPDIVKDGDPSARGDDDTDDQPAVVPAGTSPPDETRMADFVHAPVPALQARITRATTELPEGRQIQGVTILCLTGGSDCRVTGVAATPEDLRTFAETLEVAPAEGDEQAPTVEINSTESATSGMTDFEIGVYYP